MIIVRLCGGLGNQLFQFALGRCLTVTRRLAVEYDAIAFEKDPLWDFALGPYELDIDLATPQEIDSVASPDRPSGLGRLVPKPLRPRAPATHIREAQFYHFDPAIRQVPDGVYLDGYWQTERYFAPVADILRTELTVKSAPDAANREMLARIRSCTAVSLHVRRGDYVSNPRAQAHHGSCDMAYYRWAVASLSASVDQPQLFVFSDDPEWARDHLDLGIAANVVDLNDAGKGHQDLRLMSACRHHIIANSSFSWWGAWLNPDPEKMVFAPRRWLARPGATFPDILPEGWIAGPD